MIGSMLPIYKDRRLTRPADLDEILTWVWSTQISVWFVPSNNCWAAWEGLRKEIIKFVFIIY